MKTISTYKPTLSRPFGMSETDYTAITDLVDVPIIIAAVQPFSGRNGDGIYIRYSTEAEPTARYTTTHAVAIMDVFGRDDVRADLDAGECIGCRIVRAKSATTGREMFKLADY